MKSTKIKDVQTKKSTKDAYLCIAYLHGVYLVNFSWIFGMQQSAVFFRFFWRLDHFYFSLSDLANAQNKFSNEEAHHNLNNEQTTTTRKKKRDDDGENDDAFISSGAKSSSSSVFPWFPFSSSFVVLVAPLFNNADDVFGVFLVLRLVSSIPSLGRRTLSRAFCEIHLLPRVTLKRTSGVEKASETRRGEARSIRRESIRGMAKRKPDISRVFGRRRRESERFETKRGTALGGGNQRYLGKVWVSRHRQTVSRRRARGRFCRVKTTSEESIRIVSANAHHQQRGKKSQSR